MFGTSAARFNNDGITALQQHLLTLLAEKGLPVGAGVLPRVDAPASTGLTSVVPAGCARYLAEGADAVREHHRITEEQSGILHGASPWGSPPRSSAWLRPPPASRELIEAANSELLPEVREALEQMAARVDEYSGDELVHRVRDQEIHTR